MVAVVEEATAEVETVNVAVVFPDVTVTEVGSVTAEELSLSVTVVPAEGAGPVSATVP